MKYLLIVLLLSLSLPGLADDHNHGDAHHEDHKDHDHSDQEAKIKSRNKQEILISVKGMVCAFCAQGIKKNFNARPEVRDTSVDLDKMEVLIKLNQGKSLDVKTISEIVTGAGFKFVGVK